MSGMTFQRNYKAGLGLAVLLALFIGVRSSGGGVGLQAGVLITEIHYKPALKTDRTEFLELYNTDSKAVSISGWRLDGGVDYLFPAGTVIAAGGYLVVGENPDVLMTRFGVSALGPFQGRLSRQGERIILKDAAGTVMDEVDYKGGFPWPTLTGERDQSIELVHTDFGNDLGAHWRPSLAAASQAGTTAIANGGVWSMFKGTASAEAFGRDWRLPTFNDATWTKAKLPAGYGEDFVATQLNDMRSGYTSVLLRNTFEVEDPGKISGVALRAQYDDGLKIWINGIAVGSANMPEGEVGLNGTAVSALEDAAFKEIPLLAPVQALRKGINVIAVQGFNSSLGASSDFFVDVTLTLQPRDGAGGGIGPTPGRQNSVHSAKILPAIRQVMHQPEQPAAGEKVVITAKITDPTGIGSVEFSYQTVDPGAYVELNDAAYQTSWAALAMNDSGLDGDAASGDSIYTVTLSADTQMHRRLVRYRILAKNMGGGQVVAPFPEDPQPNFAYFVYNGVPSWTGAVIPSGGFPPVTYGTNVMRRLPVYHLISKKDSVETATWREKYGGDLYKWWGTLVYDGVVYDHIRYRARGGVWRYAMGKNMWKFDFNAGHDFQGRDNFGEKHPTKWTKLNLGACIQQGDYFHRGEHGMFESVGFRLFQLAGVEAPETTFVQFRIIDGAAESSATSQYEGDFWGLYLAIEQEDGRFLEEHGLPDGNLYKMEGGTGELNNLGRSGPSNKSDLTEFMSTYRSANVPDAWWRAHFDLGKYYNYRAILEAIHHYDIDEGAGKNYFYYKNPETGLWSVHPWDLDLTWSDNMYGGGQEAFKNRVLSSSRVAFLMEYRNRVRELRDLLFNADETGKLIDEHAAMIRDPSGGPSFIDADRAQWDFNPVMRNTSIVNASKAGQGRYYQAGVGGYTFDGMIRKMKAYVATRGALLDSQARDTGIPNRPVLTARGSTNFPINNIVVESSSYSGSAAFAAMAWRLAEISGNNSPPFDPRNPRHYEIQPVWESLVQTNQALVIQVPPSSLKVGRLYRVRVKMKDVTGRWSHWSAPLEFTAGEPEFVDELAASLRISEVHYHDAASESFDFVELRNISATLTLDLNGVKLTGGIELDLEGRLPPGAYLVAANTAPEVFRSRYGLDSADRVVGPFSGKLSDGGETVRVRAAAGGLVIDEVAYDDGPPWPEQADGRGSSLHRIGFLGDGNQPAVWTAATPSPGVGVGSGGGSGDPLRLSIGLTSGREVLIQWLGLPGRGYSVLSRETLTSARSTWMKLLDVDAAPGPGAVNLSARDVLRDSASEKYYQVVSPKVP